MIPLTGKLTQGTSSSGPARTGSAIRVQFGGRWCQRPKRGQCRSPLLAAAWQPGPGGRLRSHLQPDSEYRAPGGPRPVATLLQGVLA
jgi:hypothetical protein